jgi:2-hydroxychromene-2-carboxylate isomerase
MKTFEFWFDFGSSATYLAWTQLRKFEADTGARAVLKPMLLGGVFQATGNQSPVNVPAKGKYIWEDFQRWAKRYGVPFERNPGFPIMTLPYMRVAIALQMKGNARFLDYCNLMFNSIWVDSVNMNDQAAAAQTLQKAGFDPQALMALAGEQATKDALKAATQEAIDRGVFGAPTFFVGEQMFWGQDRMDFVREALGAH